MKTKLFTLLFALLSATALFAEETNLYYYIDENTRTAEVTCESWDSDNYASLSGAVVIPSSVTYDNIQYSVTSIGDWAFKYCTGLTSITIPESVTSIGIDAFYGCTGLTSITIPEGVTSIGGSAFSHCTGLTSITIPEGVTSIGGSAFSHCTGLTSITIPNSVTNIGEMAFLGCSSLTSITIPESVTSIGNYAFDGCTGLTSITIPESVTSIGNYAFYGCTGLTSITIPESVTSIGIDAFYGCTGLTSITIPNSVTNIGEYAFSGCSSLTSITWNARNYTREVTELRYLPFYNVREQITSFSFGNQVETIPQGLCYGMVNLKNVTIPENVTNIDNTAFQGSGLISVQWNATNYRASTWKETSSGNISYDAPFARVASQITSFVFGENVEHIPAVLCGWMTNLTSVSIPDKVKTIGSLAFICTGVTSVSIGNAVTRIDTLAFNGTALQTVVFPESIQTIGYQAFSCSSIRSVTFPSSMTTIEQEAFIGSGLRSVVLPDGLTTLEESTFAKCTDLQEVTISNSVTTINPSAFSGCTSLNALSLGNGVTTIGGSAFSGCTALSTLTIPNNVTTINSSAFSGCTSLRSLSLGSGITTIDNSAFSGCTALLTMEVKATLPPMIQSNTFNNVSTTVMLTVPCESQNYYKAAQYWNQFTNWQEAVLSFSAVTEDATKGKVSVTQKPTCDDPTAVIKAVPAGGYRFKEWSDGNTENPRTVWVDEEMDLVAYFAAEGDGVENIAVIEGVSIVGNRLCITGHEEENMNLYSATGAQLYAGQVRDITLPNAGVYLVQIGNAVQKLIVP